MRLVWPACPTCASACGRSEQEGRRKGRQSPLKSHALQRDRWAELHPVTEQKRMTSCSSECFSEGGAPLPRVSRLRFCRRALGLVDVALGPGRPVRPSDRERAAAEADTATHTARQVRPLDRDDRNKEGPHNSAKGQGRACVPSASLPLDSSERGQGNPSKQPAAGRADTSGSSPLPHSASSGTRGHSKGKHMLERLLTPCPTACCGFHRCRCCLFPCLPRPAVVCRSCLPLLPLSSCWAPPLPDGAAAADHRTAGGNTQTHEQRRNAIQRREDREQRGMKGTASASTVS